jgi:hypothetical protein
MSVMDKRAAAATALSGLLLLTGCTGGSDDEGSPSAEPGNKSAAAETVAADASFGEPFEFKDGVAVQVSKPKQFRPSAKAVAGGEPDFVKLKVRLVNGTKRKISPDQVLVTVASGGGQAGDVLDRRQGMMAGPPNKAVPAGEAVSWVLGYGVLDPEDVAVQVQVGLERPTVTVAG